MKSYFSIVVFFVLLLSSVVTGTDRYLSTEDLIKDDLNQALAHTIAVKGGAWLATDTIKAYKQLQNTTSGHVALLINDEFSINDFLYLNYATGHIYRST